MPDENPPLDRTRARHRFEARAVLAFVAVLLAAIPFTALVLLVRDRAAGLTRVDGDVANALHGYALDHSGFTHAMKIVSAVGGPTGWWIILSVVVGWLLVGRLFRLAAFVAVTALGSSLLNMLIKALVDRARPDLPDPVAVAAGPSFPSGHAQAATVGFGILVLVFLPLAPRRARPWLWVGAGFGVALVGFSRIALGVHYLSDVVGAVIIGSAWLLAMAAVFTAWRRELGRPTGGATTGLEPDQRDRLAHGDSPALPPE